MIPARNHLIALALGLGVAGVAGCASFPDLDHIEVAGAGATPQLMPVDRLLAQADTPARASAAQADGLAARAARLKQRAALMRGPILDPETRARLAAAIRDGRA